MVEPKASVSRPAVSEIAPEGVPPIVRMQSPQRVRPAGQQLRLGRAGRRLQQRVVLERSRRVDVEVGGHDVVVAGEDGGDVLRQQFARVVVKPIEPGELVLKFGTGLRVAVD